MATTSINLKGKGERADKGFRTLALLAGLLVLVILGYIALVTTREAQPAFSLMGLEFFFTNDWNPPADVFGAAAFIYGTLLSSLIALVFAVPISIGIALFITQIAPRWLRNPMVYVRRPARRRPIGGVRPVGRPHLRAQVQRRLRRRSPTSSSPSRCSIRSSAPRR